jgi:hypothetical protein
MATMVRRSVTAVLAAAVVVALTASCAESPSPVRVNGRELLTYQSGSAVADAAGFGVLHANAAGCLTIGKLVLVAPDGSTLNADGSIVVRGHTYRLGESIHIGGGGGNKPAGSDCGAGLTYFYV